MSTSGWRINSKYIFCVCFRVCSNVPSWQPTSGFEGEGKGVYRRAGDQGCGCALFLRVGVCNNVPTCAITGARAVSDEMGKNSWNKHLSLYSSWTLLVTASVREF